MDFDEVKYFIEKFFNGKFEVRKFLGEGSFAKVYLVNHNYLDTLMAMKIIKEPLKATTNRKKIFSEVTLACQLRHPNIISIYDAAEISDFEDGENHAYFVMEYVAGGDLERYWNSFAENNIFIPINRSLDLLSQILRGLDTLHSANPPIIHRDLKPNNILLSFNTCGDIIIKISDFGFAKEISTSVSDIDIAGTRPYMAPEIFSKASSLQSDIYAVGVIFYQLLTNRYPYEVDEFSNDELIDLKPWKEELKPPSHYNENVSEFLDEIVLKCLDANAKNRYGYAGELLMDVEKAADEFKSEHLLYAKNSMDDYHDEYEEYIINDSIRKAFELAKCEKGLAEAIEILEGEVLGNYDIRKCYSETLRIWKSKSPDLKLVSKAFTVNLKGNNYRLACNFLKEAIAYNPSLKNKYAHYIGLWEIFIDLQSHGSLFRSVVLLEKLMDSSTEIRNLYEDILSVLKTYSVDEIVSEAIRLVNQNNLQDGANLMEFAVVLNSKIRKKYSYKMSLWKQNMKMHFRQIEGIKNDTVDYAIDLGTTDSVVSYFNQGNPVIIKNHRTGEDFTPSAVLVDEKDNISVGKDAINAIFENRHNAVSEFKHNMGFSVPFRFENSSRVMFPEELSAEVLKDLRVSVYVEKGINMEHAVISVPANSNPIKTRAVNDAAELAGFRSHSLIQEPVAASIAYNLHNQNGIWMIYDLGGGTFNVTLIRNSNGEIEMIATDGLDNLGGNAFDWKIVNDVFREKIAYDLNLDDFRRENQKYEKIFAKLKNLAEEIKKELTDSTVASICCHNLFHNYDFEYTLTQENLKEIIKPLIKYTFKISKDLLSDSGLGVDDLNSIILVGGSSLSPIVHDFISDEFDCETESSVNPLTAVSEGAAIYAGSLKKSQKIPEVKSHSVALGCKDGQIYGIVFCNDMKFSYLGYEIEFKSENSSIKVPLNIGGEFKVRLSDEKYDINIYGNGVNVQLDEKSPDAADCRNIYISGMAFEMNRDISLNDLQNMYVRILNDIEFLADYSYVPDGDLTDYAEILLEVSKRNPAAYQLTSVYMDFISEDVNNLKTDLKCMDLRQNIADKIEAVRDGSMFEIENIDLDNADYNTLKHYYTYIVEKYVSLNYKRVLEDVYFTMKLDGIYTNSEKIADNLIERAQYALTVGDYDELYDIVNRLYELDERMINKKL